MMIIMIIIDFVRPYFLTAVVAWWIEHPLHSRKVVDSIPGRVIPKIIKKMVLSAF